MTPTEEKLKLASHEENLDGDGSIQAATSAIKTVVKIGDAKDRQEFYQGAKGALGNLGDLERSLSDPGVEIKKLYEKDKASKTLGNLLAGLLAIKDVGEEDKRASIQSIIANFDFLDSEEKTTPEKESGLIAQALADSLEGIKNEKINAVVKKHNDSFAAELANAIHENLDEASKKQDGKENSLNQNATPAIKEDDKKISLEKNGEKKKQESSVAQDVATKGGAVAITATLAATAGPLVAAIAIIAIMAWFAKKHSDQKQQDKLEQKAKTAQEQEAEEARIKEKREEMKKAAKEKTTEAALAEGASPEDAQRKGEETAQTLDAMTQKMLGQNPQVREEFARIDDETLQNTAHQTSQNQVVKDITSSSSPETVEAAIKNAETSLLNSSKEVENHLHTAEEALAGTTTPEQKEESVTKAEKVERRKSFAEEIRKSSEPQSSEGRR